MLKLLERRGSRAGLIAAVAAIALMAAGCSPPAPAPADGASTETKVASTEPEFETLDTQPSGELLESAGRSGGDDPVQEVSADGLKLLKANEGELRCKKPNATQHCPYNDSANYCTIGHGHLIAKQSCKDLLPMLTEKGWLDGITNEEAEAILKEDLKTAQVGLESRMVGGKLGKAGLSTAQYDALVSFIFNVGGSKFGKSTLLKKLQAREDMSGDVDVAQQIMAWKKAGGAVVPGLLVRRQREVDHFFIGYTAPTATGREAVDDIDIQVGE